MSPSLAIAAVLLSAPAFAQPIFSTGTRNPETNTGSESRNTNPGASNPNLPLPGTANPNNRAAPMVPNPQPVPNPNSPPVQPAPGGGPTAAPGGVQAPGPGGAQGSPSQRSPRDEARRESDDGRGTGELRDIRDAVLRAPAGEQEAAAEVELVEDLRVFRKNGQVVLTGTVRSREEKEAAGKRAAEASDGRPVLNLLKVK